MEWWVTLVLFLLGLMVLLGLRVPVAFALLAINIVAAVLVLGLGGGTTQLVLSMQHSLAKFTLIPVPLFILMGEVLFRSGLATRAIHALDVLLGRVPGRLGLLTTGAGTVFAVLSGSTLANTALLGKTLLPEMERRNYSRSMGMGAVMASGGLAMIIPPSTLAVIWGATAGVSVGPLLIAGIVPGLLMALGYLSIITIWSTVFKGAPKTQPARVSSGRERARSFFIDLLPLGGIIFLVTGFIFFGIATPIESAAVGAVGSMVLAALHGRLRWRVLLDSLVGAAHFSAMLLFILVGSSVYSQVMSFSGATSGVVNWLLGVSQDPLIVLLLILAVVLMLGFFLEQISIMLVTLPFFMPVVTSLGWEPIWFGMVMLIALQIALSTPPLGLGLFVMKGVAPQGTTLKQTYKAALPFVASDVVVIALLIAAPGLVLWLPGLMA